MEFTPEDDELSARHQAQLDTEKRDSELEAFKAQAESAAKAENWNEAVSAWESYLALEPEDGAGVEWELQRARKYAKIAGDYAEAQEAIRKKRYGRAIELLQGIIAQEPTYKSTSRLLVEAVEANKTIPFWRRPWLLLAVGVLALLVLGVSFGSQVSTALSTAIASRPAPATEAVVLVEPTSAPEIKPTEFAEVPPEPTVTVEPIPPTPTATQLPSWVTDFAEPILAAIVGHEPAFQDDFSTNTGWWGSNKPPFTIKDGNLRFENLPCDSDRIYEGLKIRNYNFRQPNYVLQVDISPLAPGRVYVLTNATRIGYSGAPYVYSGIYLGSASWGTCRQDVCTEFPKFWQEGQYVRITLIVQGSQAGFYLDGTPMDYFNDPELVQAPRNIRGGNARNISVEFMLLHPTGIRNCDIEQYWEASLTSFDNVKIWDLDAIGLEP